MHINTNDISGGAARAAYRLHKSMVAQGLDSQMYVKHKKSDDETVLKFRLPNRFLDRLYRDIREKQIKKESEKYLQNRPKRYELFTNDRNAFGKQVFSQLPDTDIVNLHWLSYFIDYQSLFSYVPRPTSIVWTLHDLNAFTGGCHYDLGCGRYHTGCGACPQLGSESSHDLSSIVWQRKKRLFHSLDESRLNLVAPSKWLGEEVRKSPLMGKFPIHVIPNGLDVAKFRPRDKQGARKSLGISANEKVILFVSELTTNVRKGFRVLGEALADLHRLNNIVLLSVGREEPDVCAGIRHIFLGTVESDDRMAEIYSAADIFVIPSLQDNLPNTVIESIACGTPVVGTDVGGIPDMVRPGTTGLLVRESDSIDLSNKIIELLRNDDLRKMMSARCREVAVQEYSNET
ncbi:MAG: glycosyltransferase family 4 protein [Acidiferrobacterales bacterium]